jgi:hypothetical protein
MAPAVHHCQHDQFIGDDTEIDRVRKPWNEGSARFTMNARIGETVPGDSRQGTVDRRTEGAPEPGLLVFIPGLGIEQLRLGLRPKNET